MSSQSKVTDIEKIRSILMKNYEKNHTTLSFQQAVSLAFLAEKRPEDNFIPSINTSFLSFSEFWDYIGKMPVYKPPFSSKSISKPLSQKFGNLYIQEVSLFAKNMDMNVYTHLPYVNDGIHTHDHFELNFIYHGQGEFSFENENMILFEGEFLIIAPDSPHNLRAKKDDLIISIMVRKSTFDKIFWPLFSKDTLLSAFFTNSMRQNNEQNYVVFKTQNDFLIQFYLQQLITEKNTGDLFSNENMTSLLLMILRYLLRNYSGTAYFYDCQPVSDKHCDFELLSQYIHQNYNNVTLKDVAQKFHYSESFFSKLIVKHYGVTFSVLIRELRLSHARELINHTNYTLQEICDIIGYSSVSSFSRAYKKQYGNSPGAES